MLGFGREGCSGNTHLDPSSRQELIIAIAIQSHQEYLDWLQTNTKSCLHTLPKSYARS